MNRYDDGDEQNDDEQNDDEDDCDHDGFDHDDGGVEHVEIVSLSPSSYLQEECAVYRRVQYVCDGGQSLHSDSSQHGVAACPRCY